MKYYKLYGMNVVSDFDFVQLESLLMREEMKNIDVRIREGIVPNEYKFDKECYSHVDKKISYLSNRTCYLLIENGVSIVYEKKENANLNNLNAYLLGWGIAILCYQRGDLAIHCSCIANEKGAVLLSGTSGSGKSSITACLLQDGFDLVADDMAIVHVREDGKAYAMPAFPYQKLCRDIAKKSNCSEDEMIYIDENKDKFLVPYKGRFPKKPVPVHAMIMLGFSAEEKVVSKEVKGIDKMYACADSMFIKGLLKENLYSLENVNNYLKLASCIPIFGVLRPREQDTRDEVVKEIRKYI